MLRFFRQIRKSLMEQNKTRTYLLYATGEIFLVVIGILIALQINNWNEGRKQELVLNVYYQQLLTDLEAETENLQQRTTRLESSIASYDKYIDSFKDPELSIPEIFEEIKLIDKTIEYIDFNTNTVETLQSTGDIKLIPANIRDKLMNLRNLQERMVLVGGGNNIIYVEKMQDAYAAGYNGLESRAEKLHPKRHEWLTQGIDYADILHKMEGALELKNYTERNRVKRIKIMMNEIDVLKTLIRKELNEF